MNNFISFRSFSCKTRRETLGTYKVVWISGNASGTQHALSHMRTCTSHNPHTPRPHTHTPTFTPTLTRTLRRCSQLHALFSSYPQPTLARCAAPPCRGGAGICGDTQCARRRKGGQRQRQKRSQRSRRRGEGRRKPGRRGGSGARDCGWWRRGVSPRNAPLSQCYPIA